MSLLKQLLCVSGMIIIMVLLFSNIENNNSKSESIISSNIKSYFTYSNGLGDNNSTGDLLKKNTDYLFRNMFSINKDKFYDISLHENQWSMLNNLDKSKELCMIQENIACKSYITGNGEDDISTCLVSGNNNYVKKTVRANIVDNNEKNELTSDEVKGEDVKEIKKKEITKSYIPVEDNSEWLKLASKNTYNSNGFFRKNGYMYYNINDKVKSVVGIDVSVYQSNIDWKKVKASGVNFAMIRIGFRGYGKGQLVIDSKFERNIKGALAAGVDVGVYFFSQALTKKEAVEEAKLTLKYIKGYNITYPVAIDTEYVPDADARTNKARMTNKQRTDVCIAFCETIKDAGYTPMVYACKNWLESYLQISRLDRYDIWYARYESEKPGYAYDYTIWQYSESGRVNGIKGNVDLNVSLKDYGKIARDRIEAQKRIEAAKKLAEKRKIEAQKKLEEQKKLEKQKELESSNKNKTKTSNKSTSNTGKKTNNDNKVDSTNNNTNTEKTSNESQNDITDKNKTTDNEVTDDNNLDENGETSNPTPTSRPIGINDEIDNNVDDTICPTQSPEPEIDK